MASCPRNFSWFVEGKLAGMGYPFEEDVPFLAQLGITTLVDLTGGFCQYAEAAKAHQMTVHSLSIQDFCPPTVEQIEQFLTILQNADGPVGVHCAMGRGRTGTMLACYLVAREGYSPDKAIAETRRRRRGSIETSRQEQAVRNFAEHLSAHEPVPQ